MHASDLMEQIPSVTRESTGAECARLIAEYRLPGLVVVSPDGTPVSVLPGSQLLSVIVPQYVREDRRLAHTLDEAAADEMCEALRQVTVGEICDAKALTGKAPPAVKPEDTLLEIASVMDAGHYPLILVIDRDGRYHGALTMSRVMAAIATAAGESSELVQRRLDAGVVDSVQAWLEGEGP